MSLYCLKEPRCELVRMVAEKTRRSIDICGSALNYLGNNYFVVINDDVPDFIYADNANGLIVGIRNCSEETILAALARLKLFHYLLDIDPHVEKIMLTEVEMFISYCQ